MSSVEAVKGRPNGGSCDQCAADSSTGAAASWHASPRVRDADTAEMYVQAMLSILSSSAAAIMDSTLLAGIYEEINQNVIVVMDFKAFNSHNPDQAENVDVRVGSMQQASVAASAQTLGAVLNLINARMHRSRTRMGRLSMRHMARQMDR